MVAASSCWEGAGRAGRGRHPHSGLAEANRTTDSEVIVISDRDGRAVVTKDSDFVDQHLLRGEPAGRLLISTGNVATIEERFQQGAFVEIDRSNITLHG